MGLEAVRAIDRAVFAWLERDFSLFAAVRADGGEHLALTALVSSAIAATTAAVGAAVAIPRSSALWAARWLIGEAFARIEFLLARGERKCYAAVSTGKALIGVHALTPRSVELELVGQRAPPISLPPGHCTTSIRDQSLTLRLRLAHCPGMSTARC